MLPAAARLTRSQDFGLVVRRGRRVGRPRLVVHAHLSNPPTPGESFSPRVGFVVSKAVGNSVVRHRVSRRLRHLVRDRIDRLPPGSALVVRALPASAEATSAQLGGDLDSALRKLGLPAPGGAG
ncbi:MULTISPECIES: ribonuclease P protein component [unclassified Crossiella]|uniref:ribonuclease P protein component n=1 Tax=unclassified Crossiella TaxID=2620835 RepID=UPI00207CEC4F|nr:MULTISPECIES: ribonuclease P protein component [unclassified Crossiella]MCO1581361.1 ribonuclease P protein component [Crossiella sp. SN42]WHT19519.1 ribonuclease P protein component [Crossiella sp. CA-258035]